MLVCADGLDNKAVAAKPGIAAAMVGEWRSRFVAQRLDGLLDVPRSGAPRTITDVQIEALVVGMLERAPKNPTHWSRTSMAAAGYARTAHPGLRAVRDNHPVRSATSSAARSSGPCTGGTGRVSSQSFLAKLDTTVPHRERTRTWVGHAC